MAIYSYLLQFFHFSDTQSYVLNFHGRVTQASVKNFQVIHENDRKHRIPHFHILHTSIFVFVELHEIRVIQNG